MGWFTIAKIQNVNQQLYAAMENLHNKMCKQIPVLNRCFALRANKWLWCANCINSILKASVMENRRTLNTIVTTVLISLITLLLIVSMGNDRGANITLGVVLIVSLFVFAGVMIRGAEEQNIKNTLEHSEPLSGLLPEDAA